MAALTFEQQVSLITKSRKVMRRGHIGRRIGRKDIVENPEAEGVTAQGLVIGRPFNRLAHMQKGEGDKTISLARRVQVYIGLVPTTNLVVHRRTKDIPPEKVHPVDLQGQSLSYAQAYQMDQAEVDPSLTNERKRTGGASLRYWDIARARGWDLGYHLPRTDTDGGSLTRHWGSGHRARGGKSLKKIISEMSQE